MSSGVRLLSGCGLALRFEALMFSKTLWFWTVVLTASMAGAEEALTLDPGVTSPRFEIRLEFIAVPDQKSWQKLGLKPTRLPQSEVAMPEELDHEPVGAGGAAIRLVSATNVTESRSPFQFQVVSREQRRRSIPGLELCPDILSTGMIVGSGETGAKHYPSWMQDEGFEIQEGAGIQPIEINMLDEDIHVLARPDVCKDGSIDLALQWELDRKVDADKPQRTVSRVRLNTNLKQGESLAVWCDNQSAANFMAGMKRFPIRRPKPIPLVLFVTPRGPLTPEAERVLNSQSTAKAVRQTAGR